MAGGRAERRFRRALAVGGGATLLFALVWVVMQLGDGVNAPDTATLVGLVVAVAGLPATLAAAWLAWWAITQPSNAAAQAHATADTLAGEIAKSETVQFLVGDDERRRINLRYTLHPEHRPTVQPADTAGRLDPVVGGDEGSVLGIVSHYQQTRPNRLLITGAGGSGKTVLALAFVLGCLEKRTTSDPVPVRMSIVGWDAESPLEDYLVEYLVQHMDPSRRAARGLVRYRKILPVLDGLDEMDYELTDQAGHPALGPDGRRLPSSDPPRARAALNQLRRYGNGLEAGPVILTCRTAHYDALVADGHLRNAARIAIDPVPAADAVAYLTARLPDSEAASLWEPLLFPPH